MNTADTRAALRAFYREQGWLPSARPEVVDKKLRPLLPQSLRARYDVLSTQVELGAVLPDTLYELATDLQTANLLMSRQAPASIAAAAWLYQRARPHLDDAPLVGEFGCWSGTFLAWLTGEHPEVTGIGIDRAGLVIEAATEAYTDRNVAFVVWDYAEPPPEWVPGCGVLLSAFGLSFQPRPRPEAQPDEDATTLKFYEPDRAETLAQVQYWWEVADDGAPLYTVLRVGTPEHAVAALHAFAEAGWSWDAAASSFVQTSDERFPGWTFHPVEAAQPPSFADVHAWWHA